MIQARFHTLNGAYVGFSVSGHAGYADWGKDIVCASVTSAVQMTVNGICEILNIEAEAAVLENEISIRLFQYNREAEAFIKALRLHLELLSEDYLKTIKVTNVEV